MTTAVIILIGGRFPDGHEVGAPADHCTRILVPQSNGDSWASGVYEVSADRLTATYVGLLRDLDEVTP